MRCGGLLALSAGLVLVAACSDSERSVTRIALLPFLSSAPVYLAYEEGYLAEAGIDAELVRFQAAQPVALAVAGGAADIGVTGLTAGFYNLAAGGRLRLLAAQARLEPGHPFMAYLVSERAWENGLRSLDDLAGRRAAVTQIGSTFHYMLGMLAERRGFPLESIELRPVETVGNMIAALRGGSVDLILLPGHLAEPLVASGEARILGWVGDETPWQVAAVFTSARQIQEHPERVRSFLRAYDRGVELYRQVFLTGAPADARRGELIGKLGRHLPQLDDDQLRFAPFIAAGARLEIDDLRRQLAWMQARGLVDGGVEIDDMLGDRDPQS